MGQTAKSLFDVYGFSSTEKEAALRELRPLAIAMDRGDPTKGLLYGQVWNVLNRIGIPRERQPLIPESAIEMLGEVRRHWDRQPRNESLR